MAIMCSLLDVNRRLSAGPAAGPQATPPGRSRPGRQRCPDREGPANSAPASAATAPSGVQGTRPFSRYAGEAPQPATINTGGTSKAMVWLR